MRTICLLSVVLLIMTASFARLGFGQTNTRTRSAVKLDDRWEFREAGKKDWHPAIVPGCVHTDLLNNKLIEDPFYRDNEQKLQWIGKTDWEYRTRFDLSPDFLKHKNVQLILEGLDTYASIYMNETKVLSADNMFRRWAVDCEKYLKAGENTLRIHFRSPINEILPLMKQIKYRLPAPNDQGEKTSPYTRKAPYHYGWDWGPRFVTSGIWKPVYLEAWDRVILRDFHIRQNQVNEIEAKLTVEFLVEAAADMEAQVRIDETADLLPAVERTVRLSAGENTLQMDLVVSEPELWWPNGYGSQPLYTLRAKLLAGSELCDERIARIGLRSLELRQQPDAWGKSFAFVVNGVPIFAKGGNWIPADSFANRVTRERYRQLLQSCRDAHMNMLRLWGGGYYESDEFYNLCDELGLLVWQDFMFACSLYPADLSFVENVRQEALDNVRRLRNHPSLALWCGNNEIETAWMHWGWKQQFPAKMWEDYLKIFYEVLPEVCSKLDSTRPYWPSSPSSHLEEDPDSQRIGDVHFWGVWHGGLPFTDYEKQFPRFMSEYGFQSFPAFKTVESFAIPADYNIQSPVMLAHQKNARGNQLIQEYMLREYPQPKDFESFLYVSQLLEAEGIKIGAEHLRRSMPRVMGSLYWQIDDCWPVASWSSIDYFGRWKALHYYARRFYNEVLVSPYVEGNQINIYVVSDLAQSTLATLRTQLLDFNGLSSLKETVDIEVSPLKSAIYKSYNKADLLKGQDPSKVVLVCEVAAGGKTLSANLLYFTPYKNLALPKPNIQSLVTQKEARYQIQLASNTLARGVYLSLEPGDGFFLDNYFDLLPGKNVVVEFQPKGVVDLESFRQNLRIRSLVDAF
jgi:beta-mannosidase